MPKRSVPAFALLIATLLASPVLAAGDCGVPISSGTGPSGTRVAFSGLGGHTEGRFFLLGAGDLYNSGTLPTSVWLKWLGVFEFPSGQPLYTIEVPQDGPGSWNDPMRVSQLSSAFVVGCVS